MKESNLQVVVLNAFAGIYSQTSSLASLTRQASKSGLKVHNFNCDAVLPGLCNVRRSRRRTELQVQANPKLDCMDCQFGGSLSSSPLNKSASKQHWMSKYLSMEDFEELSLLREAWSLYLPSPDQLQDGFPLMRFALYEVMLQSKAVSLEIPENMRSQAIDSLAGTFLMLRAAVNFFARNPEVSVAVVSLPQYAVNRAFAEVALKRGVRVIFLDGSPNFSEAYEYYFMQNLAIFGWRNPATLVDLTLVPMPTSVEIKRVKNHLKVLEVGVSHKVYSSPKSSKNRDFLKDYFGVRGSSKIVVAALSSTDEPLAAHYSGLAGLNRYPGTVFESQLAWVRWLIDWARRNPAIDLIIRLHPREFPNKRDSKLSPMAAIWNEALGRLPTNVHLNHPDQNVSLYDLFNITNVITTGWSSVAIEAGMQGIPFVTYDKHLTGYPAQLGLSGATIDDYAENLKAALELTGVERLQMKGNIFRWLNIAMNYSTVKLGGRFLASRREILPIFIRKPLEGLERYFFFIYKPMDLLWGRLWSPRRLDPAALSVIRGESPSVFDYRFSRRVSKF